MKICVAGEGRRGERKEKEGGARRGMRSENILQNLFELREKMMTLSANPKCTKTARREEKETYHSFRSEIPYLFYRPRSSLLKRDTMYLFQKPRGFSRQESVFRPKYPPSFVPFTHHFSLPGRGRIERLGELRTRGGGHMVCGLHQTYFERASHVAHDTCWEENIVSKQKTYTFMQVDCVFAGDDVGDGRSGGRWLFAAGFRFGSHRAC